MATFNSPPSIAPPNAAYPIARLSFSESTLSSATPPIAIFLEPVVIAAPADNPKAVLSAPVVIAFPAS